MSETPMMIQYNEIKHQHSDAILFYRLGDFYEMFHDDAVLASRELSLTLTGRGKDANRIPMCGVPHHAAENYITKLVKKGHKVAICEQLDAPSDHKGPTPRDVVRVITPGTAQLDGILDESAANFLAAVCQGPNGMYGWAKVDVSTGHFTCDTFNSIHQLMAEMNRCDAKELLVDDGLMGCIDHPVKHAFFPYDHHQATAAILTHFQIQSVSVFQLDHHTAAFPAIVAILNYLQYALKGALTHIKKISPINHHLHCSFDQGVIDHLDLFKKNTGCFVWLNNTHTSMGARKLREWLRTPLVSVPAITKRQQQVAKAIGSRCFSSWASLTRKTNDIERLLSKICANFNNPHDMVALKESLNQWPTMIAFLQELGPEYNDYCNHMRQLFSENGPLLQLINQLNSALLTDVPAHIREGGFIRPGFSEALDELCQSFKEIREWMTRLEPTLRDELNIKPLKVGFNKVFGYYIEIPNSHTDKVPDTYIRKQTLTQAERYITQELKEKETVLLHAKDEQASIEKKEYARLVQWVVDNASDIQTVATIIAEVDALIALAIVANDNGLSCPTITDNQKNELTLHDVWHPMVANHATQSFIKNSVQLNEQQPFMLITGPNMAGKSTVMRSVAICVILGQMGSFVPASSATFSIVKSLFTRIGANDNLSDGQSTFMVEMVETATICQNANHHSLILLDEIGRGTSTYDGVSIAAAVTEYLVNKVNARTFFATHYHELTTLSQAHPQIQNASMSINETGGQLTFTYKLVAGAAEKSYGVMVAKMAGLPMDIIQKANEWLNKFETDAQSGTVHQLRLF